MDWFNDSPLWSTGHWPLGTATMPPPHHLETAIYQGNGYHWPCAILGSLDSWILRWFQFQKSCIFSASMSICVLLVDSRFSATNPHVRTDDRRSGNRFKIWMRKILELWGTDILHPFVIHEKIAFSNKSCVIWYMRPDQSFTLCSLHSNLIHVARDVERGWHSHWGPWGEGGWKWFWKKMLEIIVKNLVENLDSNHES